MQRGEVICRSLRTTTTRTHSHTHTPNNTTPKPPHREAADSVPEYDGQKERRESIKEGQEGRKRVTELIRVRKTERGRRRGRGGGGPLSAPHPLLFCREKEKNRVLIGKQGQSPSMRTCEPDLHAHATFTGKATHTHKYSK